jgi:signal transduction histidine kinase
MMEESYREFPILYVDDEPQNLVTLRYVLGDEFTLLTANTGAEAVQLMERENVAILMCDQRMPGMTGVEVCKRVREMRPDVIRIIVTAYADLQAAVDAINEGQVARYVTKPWRNQDLIDLLRASIDLVRMQQTMRQMQARILRQGEPRVVEAISREIARDLGEPVRALSVTGEQVSDLLQAGLRSWGDGERARELVGAASEAQRESLTPMTRLRTIAQRLETGQRLLPSTAAVPPCDVARVVLATTRVLGPVLEPAVRIQVVLDSSPRARIEPADLGQVLTHLLVNAAQALEASSSTDRVIVVRVAERGGQAAISVVDKGPGMTAETIERAFDAYFTTKPGAAGLGLSIATHILRRTGGMIGVESEVGQGSTFVVLVPGLV